MIYLEHTETSSIAPDVTVSKDCTGFIIFILSNPLIKCFFSSFVREWKNTALFNVRTIYAILVQFN